MEYCNVTNFATFPAATTDDSCSAVVMQFPLWDGARSRHVCCTLRRWKLWETPPRPHQAGRQAGTAAISGIYHKVNQLFTETSRAVPKNLSFRSFRRLKTSLSELLNRVAAFVGGHQTFSSRLFRFHQFSPSCQSVGAPWLR